MRTSNLKTLIPSVPSKNGLYIASLIAANQLVISASESLEVLRSIKLKPGIATQAKTICWSRSDELDEDIDQKSFIRGLNEGDSSHHLSHHESKNSSKMGASACRVLLADDETIQVWDTEDVSFNAVVTKAGEELKIVSVDFGYSPNEIIAFSDCNLRTTVWRLDTGTCVKIRNPKFSTKGYGWRPGSGHFALLSRDDAQDYITIHAPHTYALLSSVTIVATDVQGLKWSPDGKWILTWESPSYGSKIQIYTADGHLYKNIAGLEEPQGLGVKYAEWSKSNQHLLIGGFDNGLLLLDNPSFAETAILAHKTTIDHAGATVYQELQDNTGGGYRQYDLANQHVSPPIVKSSSTDTALKTGISLIACSAAPGNLVATKSDLMPTTVWIWCLDALKLKTALVHHDPIKSVLWHPTIKDLLMIQCLEASGFVYFWKSDWDAPRVLKFSTMKSASKVEANWLWATPPKSISPGASPSNLIDLITRSRGPAFIYGNHSKFLLATTDEEDDNADNAESMDPSTFISAGTTADGEYQKSKNDRGVGVDHGTVVLDDTFRFRWMAPG